MSQTQRNAILKNLENEYMSFLWEEKKVLEFSFRNSEKPPSKKILKETIKQGKKLSSLVKLFTQLKSLSVQKELLDDLLDIATLTYNENEKEINKFKSAWGKYHDKQLELGTKYLTAKKAYQKTYG